MDGNGAGNANDHGSPLELLDSVFGAVFSAEVDEEFEFDRVSAGTEDGDGFVDIINCRVVAGAVLQCLTLKVRGDTQAEPLGRSRANQLSFTTRFQAIVAGDQRWQSNDDYYW